MLATAGLIGTNTVKNLSQKTPWPSQDHGGNTAIAGTKKSKLKPKKREDRLDKDGEAGGVSSMMLSVPIFQYHGVTQTNLKCLVGHMTHFNLYF